jgi:hypothetical protein
MDGFLTPDIDFLRPPHLGGGHRYRSPETEEAYRKRYMLLIRRATSELSRKPTLCEIADFIIAIASNLRPCSLRQYIAAILQLYRDMHDAEKLDLERARAAVRRLRSAERAHRSTARSIKLPVRCGARRARKISVEERNQLVAASKAHRTATAKIVAGVLRYGPFVGIRPWEWPSAELRGNTLVVRSAKFSKENRRGLDAIREIHLDTQHFTPGHIAELSELCATFQSELWCCGGDREKLMRRAQRMLRRIRETAKVDRVVLKTTRHQARSNLREAGMPKAEIAAVLGHASAVSGQAYGVRRAGWDVPLTIAGSPAAAVRVRKVEPMRSAVKPSPVIKDAIGAKMQDRLRSCQ